MQERKTRKAGAVEGIGLSYFIILCPKTYVLYRAQRSEARGDSDMFIPILLDIPIRFCYVH